MKRIWLFSLCMPLLAGAQSIAEKADALMTAYSTQHKFSGNVLIAGKQGILFSKSYGMADAAGQIPVQRNTEFRAGSLTKMFTSTLVLQLVNENKLKLDDPVSKYVAGFPYGKQVSIRHLLSHSSGITGYSPAPLAKTLSATVASFKYDSLAFTPGTSFSYNNFNYILLSYIAEKAGKKPFANLLQDKVIRAAGLKHTGMDYTGRTSTEQARGYTTDPANGQWTSSTDQQVEFSAGAGAIYTTIEDLYQWSLAMRGEKILPRKLLSLAQTPVQANYGLGWIINEEDGKKNIGHTGSIPGFKALLADYPADSLSIIFLSNYEDIDGKLLASQLKAIVFNKPYELPRQKKEITLPLETLSRYTGTYELNEHFSLELSVSNGKLYALAKGDKDALELTPETNTRFFLKGPETLIEFKIDAGTVTGMLVDMQGGMHLKKIK